jgi:kynurenine formamidase
MLAQLFGDVITDGKVYDLGQPFHPKMPHHPANPPFMFWVSKMHRDGVFPDGFSGSGELCALATHTGTHIDALGHVSRNGKAFGGIEVAKMQTRTSGLSKMGVEEIAPLILRGVLLDVAKQKGVTVLPDTYEITPQDLVAALQASGTTINPGDAVFMRTGWSQYFDDPDSFYNVETGPGPGYEGAKWLVDKGVKVSGSDTPEFEKRPAESFSAHILLLIENGIHLVEWLNLEPLSQAGVSDFVFITIPLKIVGASGSPVRPIAIK